MSSTTETGRRAEAAAANYLRMRGFDILEQNYRRPRCEIDIVAKKDGAVYFVEVKYRSGSAAGGGLEAITASKLKQMGYAARTWVADYKWRGPYQLAAIELSGPDYVVLSFIDDIII